MVTAIEIKLIKFMIIYCNGVLLDRTPSRGNRPRDSGS